MARLKIDYGIDLGTTNSAICRMSKGEPEIIKSEKLMDTTPSCVSFTKRQQLRTGYFAKNDIIQAVRHATKTWNFDTNNTYSEFKRKMGTDFLYESSYMGRSYSPEELSSEILKTLRSYVTDDSVKSVVITVPAKFTINQKDATMRAANLAGFEYCELVQEPIAASWAYGMKSDQKNGCWLVFDYGGGTFDAALVRVEDGIMQVFATDGDNYLGGKNLDYAIVDDVIIPYLRNNYSIEGILANDIKRTILREAMKTYAENAKISLSFKDEESIETMVDELGLDDEGVEMELFMDINRSMIDPVLAPFFQKAIDITKGLLQRNNMKGSDLTSLILVGGPTYTPVLRQMLQEQITTNVDTSINPMTAVAVGAALYASTIDNKQKQEDVHYDAVELVLSYSSTSINPSELVVVKLKREFAGTALYAEIVRSDNGWSSGKIRLSTSGEVVDCLLIDNKPNGFVVKVYDEKGNNCLCTPSEFSIIQGVNVGSAILPYYIGMEIWNSQKGYAIFKTIKGLEQGKPLPAVGVVSPVLKTTSDIRPGKSEDFLRIPIYQGEYDAEGMPAALCNFVYEARLTGEDLPSLLPSGSDVELTIRVDRSEKITIEVYIPLFDYTTEISVPRDTVQKSVSSDYLYDELSKASQRIFALEESGDDISSLKDSLDDVKRQIDKGDEKEQILRNLKEQLRKITKLESEGEWPRIERRLRGKMDLLKEDNEKYGNVESSKSVNEYETQMEDIIKRKDQNDAQRLLDRIFNLDLKLARVEYYIAWITRWAKDFNTIQWADKQYAKLLVEKGMAIVVDAPNSEKLNPIVGALVKLLPESEMPEGASGLLEN